jgi:hypothetical protein
MMKKKTTATTARLPSSISRFSRGSRLFKGRLQCVRHRIVHGTGTTSVAHHILCTGRKVGVEVFEEHLKLGASDVDRVGHARIIAILFRHVKVFLKEI